MRKLIAIGVCLLLLVIVVPTVSVVGATDANGFGPNYQNIPNNVNNGTLWMAAGMATINWWNWYDGGRGLWYYAYQVTNLNLQPHLGSWRMLLSADAADSTVFEGDAHRGLWPWVKWNPTVIPQGTQKWVGWAAPQGQELFTTTPQLSNSHRSSGNPCFELTSPYAPGYVHVKVSDLNYYELMTYPGTPDPFDTGYIPGPGSSLDMKPETLNMKSRGRWVTGFMGLYEGGGSEVDLSTVSISAVDTNTVNIPADWGVPEWEPGGEYGEFDTTCMAKFDRSELEDNVGPGTVLISVSGMLEDGTAFEVHDEMRVIEPA